ncbi:TniQ family protein [Paraburkholderia nemoris]|uniref:TnsD family Tn7-like transposition protein n=1 Tax=Paraburkholderia nemoris TaxID=2793076 RepID=UPI0038BCE574
MSTALPLPYSDETLFSVLARYMRIMVVENRQIFVRNLLGYSHSWGHGIPIYLEKLEHEARDYWNISVDEIVRTMTLLPYTIALSSRERGEKLMGISRSQQSHMLIKVFKTPRKVFRFCEACRRDDEVAGRLPYWRRSHQLPGVYFCPYHELALFEFDRRHANWYTIPLPDEISNISTQIRIFQSIDQRAACVMLARASQYILSCGDVSIADALRWTYREWASDAGYSRGRGSLDRVRLADQLEIFYGEDFIRKLHCGTGISIVNRIGRAENYPLTHIVLSVFLLAEATRARFAWPICPNVFAEHGAEHRFDFFRRPAEVRGFAACRCGMRMFYPLGGGRPWVTRYPEDYRNEALRLFKCGLTAREVAEKLRLNKALVCSWRRPRVGKGTRPDAEAVLQRQRQWLDLLNGQKSFSEAQSKAGYLAQWLRRWEPDFFYASRKEFWLRRGVLAPRRHETSPVKMESNHASFNPSDDERHADASFAVGLR